MITRKIHIVYHDEICVIEKFGNWIDLKSKEQINLAPMQFHEIDLGVSMKLPKYYEANVLPRSGTFKKFGIIMANSEGVIDSEYCGNNDVWKFPAQSLTSHVSIPKGTRICQFTVHISMNAPWYIKLLDLFTKFKFVEVARLTGKDRGGLGSTGN